MTTHTPGSGYSSAPTIENMQRADKRAADAEENLRTEVRSNQALVAEVKDLREQLKARDQTIANLMAIANRLVSD